MEFKQESYPEEPGYDQEEFEQEIPDEEEIAEEDDDDEQELEDDDVSNSSANESFAEVMKRLVARRNFLKSAAAVGGMLVIGSATNTKAVAPTPLTFTPIALNTEDKITVAAGYTSQVIIRWGDPLFPGVPSFDPEHQTAANQARQFGYNNDFVGFFPLSGNLFLRRKSGERGLLVVNHEYTDGQMMFFNYRADQATKEQVDIELAAHGLTVVEVEYRAAKAIFEQSGWTYNYSSYNRRITGETEILITGPAAGHQWLKTTADPSGRRARGTLNNCGAGKTPWGTVLSAEENFNQYFANNGQLPDADGRKAIHTRYGLPSGASERRWEKFYDRFDLAKEPNEPFRFGWVVEIDPYNPNSTPKKRTALGRLKHEAATTVISKDDYAVVYTGDDERFDYLYKFVSAGKYNANDRTANLDLLDAGTLYVAKFNDDGTGVWLPLIAGQGQLANWTTAEILINTRGAGDAVGATKMDRPEDLETNPRNGKIYAVFTNNTLRGTAGRPGPDKANPRPANRHGHIIEMTETGNDAAATTFNWEIFCLCGDPAVAADNTYWAGWEGHISPISSPDNIVFDNQGNLWIATDGQPGTLRKHDGIYAVPVEGAERGWLRQFMSCPTAAEVCGPEFTPDNRTLFAAIQHPGEGGTIAQPTSLWPDNASPARPSVIAIRASDGQRVIGG